MKFRSSCPVSNLLDIVGDRWSLLIIRDIFMGRNTFSSFLEAPEKISTNVLSDRLKKLTNAGLLNYKNDLNDNKRKIYSLTSKGIDLYPIIVEMSLWSKKHLNVEFHPLSVEFFNEIEEIGVEKHLENVKNHFYKSL